MKKLISTLLVLLISFILAVITYEPAPSPDKDTLAVHFLDVGQANCQVILLPDNKVMMIDAGNNDDSALICNYLDSLGISTIDYLIGTHPHEDHIGSMDTVINNYSIGSVYIPDAQADTQSYRDFQKAMSRKSLGATLTSAGTVICENEMYKAVAVAPVYKYDDLNNMSIVIRLTYKDASFLFTGDAEEESENDITDDISADVLCVPHHGSSTSLSDYFLNRVDPMYAVISCGKNNDYGHPHWETMEKLENDDIVTYRTDTMGTVICTTLGNGANDYYWERHYD
ncbi:MAG: MBL fold metallo-hydrolase [Clostridia bacterium]|nr:MBL fold metallo-hydrolase [Clostridia bacterium]